MKNYQELSVWKTGIRIVTASFQLSKSLPNDYKYSFTSQLTRAAVSIPANVAEGSSRKSERDYNRYLQISLGSAFELETYLVICSELGWGLPAEIADLKELVNHEIRMLQAFMKKLG